MSNADRMRSIQVDWEFFYWSAEEKNLKGESLSACVSQYGVGGWFSTSKNMAAALVFKSEERLASNSWLLGVKRLSDHVQASAPHYERIQHSFKVPVGSVFGSKVRERLLLRGLWKDADVDPD